MIVLILVVSCVPLTLSRNDEFGLVGNVSASTSIQSTWNETLWLDSYGDEYPSVYSVDPLTNGTSYLISIEGTWSAWGASSWLDVSDPPIGPFEEAPMYTSGGTGRVGNDPFWAFSHIYGSAYENSSGYVPLPAKSGFRISLDNGASWSTSIRPANDVYSSSHKYEVTVTGEGDNIGFRIIDNVAYDNYGMFKIIITEELIVPSAPQNLIAGAGDGYVVLTWSTPLDDGGALVTGYNVYRGTTSGNETLLVTLGNVLGYNDGGLTNNQAYYYKVSANSSAGEGALTEEKVAIPTASGLSGGSDMTLIIAIVVVVAIAGIGSVLFFIRKKKKKT